MYNFLIFMNTAMKPGRASGCARWSWPVVRRASRRSTPEHTGQGFTPCPLPVDHLRAVKIGVSQSVLPAMRSSTG